MFAFVRSTACTWCSLIAASHWSAPWWTHGLTPGRSQHAARPAMTTTTKGRPKATALADRRDTARVHAQLRRVRVRTGPARCTRRLTGRAPGRIEAVAIEASSAAPVRGSCAEAAGAQTPRGRRTHLGRPSSAAQIQGDQSWTLVLQTYGRSAQSLHTFRPEVECMVLAPCSPAHARTRHTACTTSSHAARNG